jgi:C4-dicarboxylate-specific signal transduction histidine kinase
MWSKEHYRIFEIPEDQPQDQLYALYREKIHPEDIPKLDSVISAAQERGQPFTYDHRICFPDGRLKHVRGVCKVIIDDQGTPVRANGTCQDITDVVEAQLALELERAKVIQTAKLASLGELSAGVAHEINNPLAIIGGSIGILEKVQDDAVERKARIESIKRAVGRISRIVDGLRKFSRTSMSGVRTPLALADLVSSAQVMFEPRAKQLAVELKMDLENRAVILCDEVEIEQVIVNLANNALDAIKDLSERKIQFSIFTEPTDEDIIVLRVCNSGPRISSEIESKLFQPFFTTKPVGEGTGLGLSIVKGIVEQHNGSIRLNHDMPGPCFEVRLPVYRGRS